MGRIHKKFLEKYIIADIFRKKQAIIELNWSSFLLVGLITNSYRTIIRLGTIKGTIICSQLVGSNTIFQGDKIEYADLCMYACVCLCMYVYIYRERSLVDCEDQWRFKI